MAYLLFLKKFSLSLPVFVQKLEKLFGKVSLQPDEKGYVLTGEAISIEKLLELPEVDAAYQLTTDWKPFSFFSLRQNCLEILQDQGKETYRIQTKFYDKVPVSVMSIYKHVNPYVKHEGFVPDETGFELVLFLEFKKDRKNIFYRVSFREKKASTTSLSYPFAVIIEEPRTVEEVADLLRVCWIFQLPLYIVTTSIDEKKKLFLKAKELVKGIDLEQFTYFIQRNLPPGFTVVGFSKHAQKSEKELLPLFNQKLAFLFGNETYGLSQELRDQATVLIKLGPASKKPFTASQALSYVLGLYTAKQI
ncbi:hypothetical protein HZB00_00940 [Candidatus Woesearchaeota archaeon]|nr:hypothetical protein [Candidatus Woesearchaeota archaeon]